MNAIRFHTMVEKDGLIHVPPGLNLECGQVEVIVLYSEHRIPLEAQPEGTPKMHLFDRLAQIAQEFAPKDMPADLAENHDHYAHGAPKGLDRL